MISAVLVLLASNGCVFDEVPQSKLGGLQPRRFPKVELVAETLQVTLYRDSARFRARYHLRNLGAPIQGTYAAPIDYAPSEFGISPDSGSDGFDPRLWSRGSVSVDGAPPLRLAPRDPVPQEAPPFFWRRWATAKLALSSGDHLLDLDISTSASYMDSDEKGASGIRHFSPRTVQWDPRPASRWGNGRIGSLVIRVDDRNLARDSIPLEFQGLALDSSMQGPIRVYRGRNVDLARSPIMRWSWDPGLVKSEAFLRTGLWKTAGWRGSSDPARYGLSHLNDGNWSTAWVAPEGGKGAWLETDIPSGVGIAALLIAPGYAKSAKLWTENDRIAGMKVAFPGKASRRFTWWGRVHEGSEDFLPDRLGHMWYVHPGECEFDARHPGGILRIEIDSTIPGTRSRDLAISEIAILRCPDSSSP